VAPRVTAPAPRHAGPRGPIAARLVRRGQLERAAILGPLFAPARPARRSGDAGRRAQPLRLPHRQAVAPRNIRRRRHAAGGQAGRQRRPSLAAGPHGAPPPSVKCAAPTVFQSASRSSRYSDSGRHAGCFAGLPTGRRAMTAAAQLRPPTRQRPPAQLRGHRRSCAATGAAARLRECDRAAAGGGGRHAGCFAGLPTGRRAMPAAVAARVERA